MKNMQADLAERDSLIRVLQHHSSLSRASSISSLLASSHCASPRLSPQQQHRSPASLVLHAAGSASKPSSGASSRQGSQLSAASLSLTKNSKFGLYTVKLLIEAGSLIQDGESRLLVSTSTVGNLVGWFEHVLEQNTLKTVGDSERLSSSITAGRAGDIKFLYWRPGVC